MCCLTIETTSDSCWKSDLLFGISHVLIKFKNGGRTCGKKGTHFIPNDVKMNITALRNVKQ